MNAGQDNPTSAWRNLSLSLGGSFTARARGLLNPELVLLDPGGDPFGNLAPHGEGGATLIAGDAEAKIKRAGPSLYEMTPDGARLPTLEAAGPATAPEIRSAHRTYGARIVLLRNRATAQTPENRTTAQVLGGFSNRRYRATFDPDDPSALPVALFLLYRLNALRSRAYQTG